jgi:S1-C subfamily serine protease
MRCALFLASFVLVASTAPGQGLSVLHIKVVVLDSAGQATPVARHVLLISDNPPSAPPRAIVTTRDGTAEVRLRPGNYIVESERSIAFEGRLYEWTERVDIAAGREAVLELTAENADVEVPSSATTTAGAGLETDPSFLLPQWQGSVVALWSPTTHGSGFLFDARGLIATNERVVGNAAAVEVQISPEVKVMARVLAADRERNVAILWIDPKVAAPMRPIPLGCAEPAASPVVRGQDLFTIGVPLRAQKGITSGPVMRVERHLIVTDFRVARGSAGGPVFAAGGRVVGITSLAPDDEESRRDPARVVPLQDACDAVAAAETRLQGVPPPDGTLLPVEPRRPFPTNDLKAAAQRRAGSLSPPQLSSSDFDIAFITPVLVYGAQQQGGDRGRGPASANTGSDLLRPLREFSNWSEYVDEFPPVLLIRVTPKLVEGFWTTVARGAARTQGMALPPIKRAKAAFSRMRALCGDAEVTPIHPFKIGERGTEREPVYEGLYAFDPGALGPHCGTVTLVLYSEQEPEKGDTRVVDPKVLQRTWEDFAPYRAAGGSPVDASGGARPNQ